MIYLVQFEKSVQITEDSWRAERISLEVDENANLKDILKWAVSQNGKRLPTKIELTELQVLSKEH
jgi:hypothetical protein